MEKILNVIKCLKSLNKSTPTETVEDNVYKQKEGRVSSIAKQVPTSPLKTKTSVDVKAISKPLHLTTIPMQPRQGNTSEADRRI